MFNELGKIFDRSFVVGFFVPSLAFLLVTAWVMRCTGHGQVWPANLVASQLAELEKATTLGLVAWAGGFFLQALNRQMVRLMEGYLLFRLHRRLNFMEVRRYRKLRRRIQRLESESLRADEQKRPFRHQAEYNDALAARASLFPTKESLILPTRFGNIMRSYEDYPRHVYGFESIQGWTRLQAVIPKDSREAMEAGRAPVDLWVNCFYLSLVLCVECLLMPHVKGTKGCPAWFPVACVAAAAIAYRQACGAALQWGESVKAAFDAFLPTLCKQMGYRLPPDPQAVWAFWQQFSVLMVYRSADELKGMATFRDVPAAGDASAGGKPAPAPGDRR